MKIMLYYILQVPIVVFACDAPSLSENRQKRNDLLRFPVHFRHPVAQKKAMAAPHNCVFALRRIFSANSAV